jgi:hypothetical protein
MNKQSRDVQDAPSIWNPEFKWTRGANVQATWRKYGWTPPSERAKFVERKVVEQPSEYTAMRRVK